MPKREYPGVYIEETKSGAHAIKGVPTSVTAFIGTGLRAPAMPHPVHSYAAFVREFGAATAGATLHFAVRQFFENGGKSAVIASAPTCDVAGVQAAFAALDNIAFNLLCIPPPTPSTDVPLEVWDAAATYCRARRAFLIVDAPAAWTLENAAREAAAFRLSAPENAALYFPRVLAPNPFDGGKPAAYAPCGFVAGVISRTDESRGVWKAPAGLDTRMNGAADVSLRINDAVSGRLNPAAINCLRAYPNVGIVVWGARTMAGADVMASEWKYVPVRRLALFIAESLDHGTQWVVLEPNGEKTWARVRQQIEDFLHDLFRAGAFQGAKAEEAYFVRCDQTTMTPDDIANGRLVAVVGFAPLKPGEFVVLQVRQKVGAGGV